MDGSSDETRPCRASRALAVASHAIPVRKLPSRPTAHPPPANANDGGAGSTRGARTIPNTKITSRGRKDRGPSGTPITGGSTGVGNPEYCERNRALQRERDARRGERVLAKMDVSTRDPPVPSGTYRLSPVR